MDAIFAAIKAERGQQDAHWGIQNHPDFNPGLTARPGGVDTPRLADEYEVPTPKRARALVQLALLRGELNWFAILQEEVSEVLQWQGKTQETRAKLKPGSWCRWRRWRWRGWRRSNGLMVEAGA